MSQIKTSAQKRGLKFDLTLDYLDQLLESQNFKCAISKLDLDKVINKGGNASLDRINSKLDYIKGNVQWVEKRINKMKQDLPQDEFIQLCIIIGETYGPLNESHTRQSVDGVDETETDDTKSN